MEYQILEPGHIRLLELSPATNGDTKVECSIRYTPLLSAPKYEALSYQWGSSERIAEINTLGGHLKINKSLYQALQAVRWKDRPRILWADGVCVNQQDKLEVSNQLAIMDAVYERSERTIVWLGCSTNDSGMAIRTLYSLALLARQHNMNRTMKENEYSPCVISKRPETSSVFPSYVDVFVMEFCSTRGPTITELHRDPEQTDDDIFRFADHSLWREIDGLFTNSYFERTWIEREVAKARQVHIYRGQYCISWPIFHSAFVGRSMLLFHTLDKFPGPLKTVIDARERWRDPGHCTTLAGALVALAYSKESDIRDHIYAAYALTKLPIPWFERKRPSVPIEKLLRRTSRACIEQRDDIYHLGLWCIPSRRSLKAANLPSWVPDYTTGTCELAVQDASQAMSTLVGGTYEISGDNLYLNAHLLDTIEWSHDVGDCGDIENIMEIVVQLDERYKDNNGLFGGYSAYHEGWIAASSPDEARRKTMVELSQAESILQDIPGYPTELLQELWIAKQNVYHGRTNTPDHTPRMLEILWSLLNPKTQFNTQTKSCLGEQLFLAWLYMTSRMATKKGTIHTGEMPNAYGNLMRTLLPLGLSGTGPPNATEHLSKTHISQCETECVFVTKRGFLGRTVANEVKPGDVVAFLQGGWTPYILEKKKDFFKIKSFAFVEGLSQLKTLAPGSKIERICLR